MKSFLTTIFFILALTFTVSEVWSSPEEGYMLDNNLKVILSPQENSPVVALRLVVKTGASSEAVYSEYGLAHLMEHMAFKGTAKFKAGEISKIVEDNGGDMNAYTSSDETVYYLTLPKESLEIGLEVLAQMTFAPTYDAEEYKLEKEVVIEEIKRGLDNPDRLLMETFFELAYPKHPYGRTVIGFEDSVKNVSLKEAKSFHDKYYVPENMFLVLTGGFEAAEAQKLTAKYFDRAKSEKALQYIDKLPNLELAQKTEIKIIKSDKAALAKVIMGFRGPSYQDPDSNLLELISTVLSSSDSSRLIENVKLKQSLVSSISSYAYSPKYQGSFLVTFETEPHLVPKAMEAVAKELENLFVNTPDEAEIKRAIVLAEKTLLNSQETASGFGSQLASFEHFAGDWRLKDAYVSHWKKANKNLMLKTMAKIFKKENLAVVVMLPEKVEVKFTEADLLKIWHEFKIPELNLQAQKEVFENFTLNNGIKVYVLTDKTLPKISLKAGALGGLLAETEKDNGLVNFMVKVWAKSPVGLNSTEFSRKAEDLGADITSFSGKNSLGLSADILTENWENSLKLFTDVLQNPKFDEINVAEIRVEIIAAIKAREENLSRKTLSNLTKQLYPNHPYGYDALGNLENVESFKKEDLLNNYQKLINPENLVIIAMGDITAPELEEALNKNLELWKNSEKMVKVKFPSQAEALKGLIKNSEILERAQMHLAVGYLTAGLGADDEAALTVLNAYLSGMGGPLFRELRDKQSLAYTVTSLYSPGLDNGFFLFYIASDPEKTETALKGIDEIVKNIKINGISKEDLEGAKKYLIGQSQISRQTLASRANDTLFNVLYGLGLNYSNQQIENYKNVSQDDIKNIANKYFIQDKRVISSVGKLDLN